MKKPKIQIAVGLVLLLTAVLINTQKEWVRIVLFALAYLTVGWDILLKAVKNVIKGKVFDENFLMSVATIGTFFIAQYAEGVAVMLFYQVGELFQSNAVAKSRKSVAGLMSIRPEYANNYGQLDYTYYPRGRVNVYKGVAYVNINSLMNCPHIIDAIIEASNIGKLELELDFKDAYQGSHYDFKLK